eukprot:g3622.t1
MFPLVVTVLTLIIIRCNAINRNHVETSDGVIVNTTNGPIRGENVEYETIALQRFLGIPYAKPPVEEMRWKAPEIPEPWKDVLDTRAYKHNCMQTTNFDPYQYQSTLSEDCLYLNVFTPLLEKKNPVLVWIHGGGFQNGGANESRLNGTFDVATTQDLVVVTLNYRLNVFGFLGVPSWDSTCNFGILDQRLALQWVQDNILYFGGDPERVFLVGESAGGGSVLNHLTRPKSFGLFHRAGVESGAYVLVDPQPEMSEYDAQYEALLNRSSCKDVDCLKNLDAKSVLDFSQGLTYEPCVDGVDLQKQIVTLLHNDAVAPDVPVLIGSTREDLDFVLTSSVGYIQCDDPSLCNRQDFVNYAESIKAKMFSSLNVSKLVDIYEQVEVELPGGNNSKWWWAARHAAADVSMICPARATARWLGQSGRDVYLYLFSKAPSGTSGVYPNLAHHASEIPFVFHVLEAVGPNADAYYLNSEKDIEISSAMLNFWRNFASTADPNRDKSSSMTKSKWRTYLSSRETMVFGDYNDEGVASSHFDLKTLQCDFWEPLLFGGI